MNDFLNKKIIEIRQDENDPFLLIWTINNICNNSCIYCPELFWNGKNYNHDLNQIIIFTEILFKKHKNINFHITGGEPTLSPIFLDIVKIFYDNKHKISLITNGVKSVNFWKQNSKYFNFIAFSFHPTSNYNNNFIDKVKEANKHTNVGVRIMMLPTHWDLCLDIYEKLKKEKILYEFVKIMNFNSTEKEFYYYSKDQEDWMINNKNKNQIIEDNTKIIFSDKSVKKINDLSFNDLINNNMTNFYGYECNVGIKTLTIDWEGNVFLSNCGIKGSIGNINNPLEIKWPQKPIICNKNKCYCITDVYINKKKILNFLKIF